MKIAFVIYKYFPFGGLQRDFLRVAKLCHDKGYRVDAYCLTWEGERPQWLNLTLAPVKALSKIRLYRKFQHWLMRRLKAENYDVVVGFNKMPGLDVYFSGDPCYANKAANLRGWWYKYTGRYRHFSEFEAAIFAPGAKTRILQISKTQQKLFERFYGTEPERVTVVPPGISRDRVPGPDAAAIRQAFRSEFGLDDDQRLILQIGSGFRTKGVDRSIKALASLPLEIKRKTRLFVIGEDNPAEYKRMAKRIGVDNRVTFFKGRNDVPRFLLGADLLVHPAYAEAAGTVILEAVISGLPALVTDVCGYAEHVSLAKAGIVLPSPFKQEALNKALHEMLIADKSPWQANGLAYGKAADIYSLHQVVLETIEEAAREKQSRLNGVTPGVVTGVKP